MSDNNDYKLSFFETLTMATGFTVGAGIITLTGIGIGTTGRSIFLAFLVCAVLFLIAFRPIFIMSTILPRMSAAYTYSRDLLGKEIGGLYAYMYFLGRLTIAIFGISFAQYLASLIPVLNNPLYLKIVSVNILTIFFIVNLCGVKAAAKIQNIMFVILILGLLSFVVFGIGKIQPDFFAPATFFIGGFGGFYTTVALLFFAVGGAYIITDFAPSIKNASKIMVKIIFIVTIGVCFIYMLLGVVASGAVPLKAAAFKTLAVTAKAIFPNTFLYAFFIIGGALGALITTLNSSFLWYSSSLINACNEGWFPASWAKKNKNGVPYILMTIFYLFGLIPTLLGIDLTVLSKLAVGMTILSVLIPMAGILNLPKRYPQEWADSKYAKKYPMWRIRIMVVITYLILATQVYSLFSGNPPLANILIIGYILVVGIYLFIRYKKRTENTNENSDAI